MKRSERERVKEWEREHNQLETELHFLTSCELHPRVKNTFLSAQITLTLTQRLQPTCATTAARDARVASCAQKRTTYTEERESERAREREREGGYLQREREREKGVIYREKERERGGCYLQREREGEKAGIEQERLRFCD